MATTSTARTAKRRKNSARAAGGSLCVVLCSQATTPAMPATVTAIFVKIAVTVAGIAGVVAWLQRTTHNDPPAARALFFRRFAVLAVLVVAINLTWHFFRAWLPLFLRTKHGYSL